MREQIRHLEDSIKQFHNLNGSEYDLRKMFFLLSEFFLQNDTQGLSKNEMTEKGQVTDEWKQAHSSLQVKSYHPFFE